MKINRILIGAALLMGASFSVPTLAQNFPEKAVTLVVPYPAGGATDVIGRMVAEKLPAQWKQQVVVTNRPGAGTTLAAEGVARAPGDGYTLYITTAAHTISASLYGKLKYDPVKDFAPITLISTIPLVMLVNPSLPVNTLPELIQYAKAQKNGLTMASPGNGTPQHLAGELFKSKTGTPLTHVPYKGDTPMLTDLIGGQVQVAFVTLSAALPYINSGKLKPIALAHPKRVDAIASVPTMAQAGVPDFSAATWFGIYGPGTMNEALRQKISADIQKIVAEPAMTQRLRDMGGEVNNSTPEGFQKVIDAEVKNWSEAVRLSGARID
ncbi:Bug family tripartite tricarboxylate transporter substrate binding protein [Zwartia panacis]|uniref:Bug family tripartite tricarboxylate transporter substrate binding protein n=1 Tax=Zwartia panacis TaxID=2683345 RepID=UPI0025B3A214|nr:tripartite tricarboxylate transporter substrate binding protein [Zwartia panacis]MDN4016007.1 tripartite tricarboxylate transporter substrate binding protein [Zwartia panacis]